MPDPSNPPSSSDPASSLTSDLRATRRGLLQGGLAATPVLMTLVSRPVLAQQMTTPSAFMSGNASTPGVALTSLGRGPHFWKQPQSFPSWRPPYSPTGTGTGQFQAALGAGASQPTLFDSVFAPNYQGKSLLDVLRMANTPRDDVARYAVAVLLNIAAGWTPVITVHTVKEVWSEYISKGYYEPNAGIHWDGVKIVQYFQSTISG